MLPLTFAGAGERVVIASAGGHGDLSRHLEELGMVAGTEVMVVSSHGGDMIVSVKGSKFAVNRSMSSKIMVREAD